MAVIKYVIKENTTVGTHSFFCSPKSYSTLTSDDIKDEVSEGMGLSPEIVASIIRRYMQVAGYILKRQQSKNGCLSRGASVFLRLTFGFFLVAYI